VNIAGSTAVQPVLQKVASVFAGLTPPISIIYYKLGSCAGLNDMLSTPPVLVSGTGAYIDGAGNATTCTAPVAGQAVDLAVADVFPATCTSVGQAPAFPATGFNDFWGPIQVMTFVVPGAPTPSARTSISADAAYTVFGFAGQAPYQVLTWTDPLEMYIRPASSGTINMIGTAIGLKSTKWLPGTSADGGDLYGSQRLGGSGAVLSALQTAPNPDKAIGIVAADFADKYRSPQTTDAGTTLSALKILAYKHTGQSCGYLPDSDSTHYDKINVRQGRYAIWGQVHMIAPVDTNNVPTNADVATIIQYFNSVGKAPDQTLTPMQKQTMINAEADAFTVPWCAMQVQRSSEIGTPAAFAPTEPCGCYYESHKGSMVSSYCQQCSTDPDCADAGTNTHCRYGFCEAN
jgi:ABC-type phosphate transport system substrate-binding protein